MAKKSNGLKPYKSYRFLTKDPIIDLTRTVVQDSGYSYAEISHASGVSANTMYNWFHGKTRRPQFATIEAVGRACSQTLVWRPLKNRDNR